MKRHLSVAVVVLVIVSLLLSACAPATPQIVEVEKEVPVEKKVVETVIVEKEVPVEKKVVETVVVEKEVPVEKVVKETVIVEKKVVETVIVEKEVKKYGKITFSPDLQGGTVITDPAMTPKNFSEAPMLAELVKDGKLPPVEQRLPEEPLVVEPLESIGKYGGTMRMASMGNAEEMNRLSGVDKLIFWNATGTELVPSVAKEWGSDDGRIWTITLRKGMKWSDGEPFTTEDLRFWWEDVYGNSELNPVPDSKLMPYGKPAKMEVVDQWTVRWIFEDTYWIFPEILAESYSVVSRGSPLAFWLPGGPYHPAHYMKQFHPKYVAKDELDKKVADAKLDNWVALYTQKVSWYLNPDMPVLSPWITVKDINAMPGWTLERNPYFWIVDTEGNQLPYIDKWQLVRAENAEIVNLRVLAGEYDFEYRTVDFLKMPTYLENMERGNYRVMLDKATWGMQMGMVFNQDWDKDPEIATWLRTADFRRAISLGIDRHQFNEAFWLGLATEGSPVVGESSPENPGPEYRTLWSTYDPEKANEMLDKLGLDKKDAEGYRLRADGTGRLVLDTVVDSSLTAYRMQGLEMFAEQMKHNLGLQINIKPVGATLWRQMREAGELYMTWASSWGSEYCYGGSDFGNWVLPAEQESPLGTRIGKWYKTNGEEGVKPEDPELLKALELYRQGWLQRRPERDKTVQEIWKIVIDQQYAVGIVGLIAHTPRVVRNGIGNMPDAICVSFQCRFPATGRSETWYWEDEAQRQ